MRSIVGVCSARLLRQCVIFRKRGMLLVELGLLLSRDVREVGVSIPS
jgi:hypothetical protein